MTDLKASWRDVLLRKAQAVTVERIERAERVESKERGQMADAIRILYLAQSNSCSLSAVQNLGQHSLAA